MMVILMVFRKPRRVCVLVDPVEEPLDDAKGDESSDVDVG